MADARAHRDNLADASKTPPPRGSFLFGRTFVADNFNPRRCKAYSLYGIYPENILLRGDCLCRLLGFDAEAASYADSRVLGFKHVRFGGDMAFAKAPKNYSKIVFLSPVLDSGFIYLDISPLTLVMMTAGVYLSAVLISKKFSRSFCPEGAYRVDFRIGCKAFSLDGFADTGNTARDLFSGLPVIICTGTVFEGGRGIRAVPYKTVSGEGVLYAILPEGLTLTNEKGEKKRVDALVAGLPGGEKRAVFNPKILY